MQEGAPAFLVELSAAAKLGGWGVSVGSELRFLERSGRVREWEERGGKGRGHCCVLTEVGNWQWRWERTKPHLCGAF